MKKKDCSKVGTITIDASIVNYTSDLPKLKIYATKMSTNGTSDLYSVTTNYQKSENDEELLVVVFGQNRLEKVKCHASFVYNAHTYHVAKKFKSERFHLYMEDTGHFVTNSVGHTSIISTISYGLANVEHKQLEGLDLNKAIEKAQKTFKEAVKYGR